MSHLFLGEGDPLRSQGEGEYQSVTGTKRRGGSGGSGESSFSRGGGGKGWGDREESSFPRRGWGTIMSHPKGPVSQGGRGAPPITRGRGYIYK